MNVQIKTKSLKSTIYNNSKKDEILRCKSDKYVHDTYAEDFKTQMKEIKEDIKKWRYTVSMCWKTEYC